MLGGMQNIIKIEKDLFQIFYNIWRWTKLGSSCLNFLYLEQTKMSKLSWCLYLCKKKLKNKSENEW